MISGSTDILFTYSSQCLGSVATSCIVASARDSVHVITGVDISEDRKGQRLSRDFRHPPMRSANTAAE